MPPSGRLLWPRLAGKITHQDSQAAPVPCLSPSRSGAASCERPRSDPRSPCTSPVRCDGKADSSSAQVCLPVSSAFFHSFSADLHLPAVLVLHFCTKTPPAQKSAFYSASKAWNTRTLMPSRYYVYPKTRAKGSCYTDYFPDSKGRFKAG